MSPVIAKFEAATVVFEAKKAGIVEAIKHKRRRSQDTAGEEQFGVKTAVVVLHKHRLMLGTRSFPGNPYDGHILSAVIGQASILMQDIPVKLKQIVADLGFRGVDADNPERQIIHRGKFKSLSAQQRRWLKRRQAAEPAIGHLKADHRMDRCWLQGALGDALHAISCAAGYNIRWLLRAIARLGIGALFLHLLGAALPTQSVKVRPCGPHGRPWTEHLGYWLGKAAPIKTPIWSHLVCAG